MSAAHVVPQFCPSLTKDMTLRFTMIALSVLVANLVSFAQSTQDLQAIRSMCGCYEVTFSFAETFSPDTAYAFHDNYQSSALEWVEMVRDEGDLLQLQHILVVGGGMTVKHWRQDWIYQPEESMTYSHGRLWNLHRNNPMEVAGKWEQRVFQVDDSPRYAATGTWIHEDGKQFWEAQARTPLPRREYTKRSDYDVMDRLNRHEIHSTGWTHEQDNVKVMLEGEEEVVIAEEKGRNTYVRVDKDRCQAAQNYWEEHRAFWQVVRDEWVKHLTTDVNSTLSLQGKVDGKPLYVHFMDHPTDDVSEIIESFIQK